MGAGGAVVILPGGPGLRAREGEANGGRLREDPGGGCGAGRDEDDC